MLIIMRTKKESDMSATRLVLTDADVSTITNALRSAADEARHIASTADAGHRISGALYEAAEKYDQLLDRLENADEIEDGR